MVTVVDDYQFPEVNRAELLSALGRTVPASQLLFAEEDLRPYECDGLSAYRKLPLAVVLPDSVEQVQAIMKRQWSTCPASSQPRRS